MMITCSSLPELLEKKRLIDMHTNIATALLSHIKVAPSNIIAASLNCFTINIYSILSELRSVTHVTSLHMAMCVHVHV